jgi:N-acetylmuramoyl-L-alanine amidase
VDRGMKPGLFYVLALSKRPSVLLEVGFMSNTKDLQLINGEKFRKNYLEGIVQGVERYFTQQREKKSLANF